MLDIKIKYFDDSIEKIEKVTVGDWIDLRARKDMVIPYTEYGLIPLNVAMELPKGYEAIVAPRSSTFKNYGLMMTNSIGIIDESYMGDNDEWHFPGISFAMMGSHIHKGDRICQFRIIEHQPTIEFTEVKVLGNENRGGIGSTGKA